MSRKQKVLIMSSGGYKIKAEGTVFDYKGISLVTVKDGSYWRVYETSTGYAISDQWTTKTAASAKENAIAKINKNGIKKVKEDIKRTLESQATWETPTHAEKEWIKYTRRVK